MSEQVNLAQFQSESYTLSGLKRQKNKAEEAELDNVTVTFEVGSPDTFSHSWTFEGVSSLEEYRDELRNTEDAALNRLANWHDRDESYSEDEVDLTPTEFPEQIEDFKDKKKSVDGLEEMIEKTENVYERTDDRSRNISIANKMNSQSSNLKEYKENMDKVEKNLDFEEEMNVGEDGDVFSEERQKTTGDLTWINEDGQEVFTQAFSTGVVHQIGGPGGIRIEQSHSEAKDYYEENKYA